MTARRQRARDGRSGSGFILIYTLWILAACSVVLALLIKTNAQPPALEERLLNNPIELKESINVLDYVLEHSFSQTRQVDPRFIEYQRSIAAQSVQSKQGIIQELKDILAQLGMELDIEDDSKGSVETTTVIETGQSQEDDKVVTIREGRQFGIAEEPYRIKPGESEFQVRIRPANALPNLNTLPRRTLIRYLAFLGLEQERAERLAGVVRDWIDIDDFLSEAGAESMQYSFGRAPRNGPIETWGEVFYLKGSNARLVAFLRRHFVLHSTQRKVDARYFQADALAALTDLPEEEVSIALENEGYEEDEKLPLEELISEESAARFRARADWESDQQILLVEVQGPSVTLSSVFDARNKQLLDWYLDSQGASAGP